MSIIQLIILKSVHLYKNNILKLRKSFLYLLKTKPLDKFFLQEIPKETKQIFNKFPHFFSMPFSFRISLQRDCKKKNFQFFAAMSQKKSPTRCFVRNIAEYWIKLPPKKRCETAQTGVEKGKMPERKVGSLFTRKKTHSLKFLCIEREKRRK